MFYFRINKLKIFDNREGRRFRRKIGRKEATIQLVSFVTTENTELSDLQSYLNANDINEKNALLQQMMATTFQSKKLTPIQHIKDNQQITFGDVGYVLFQSENIPQQFDWQCIVIEIDEQQREMGAVMQEIINSKEMDTFAGNFGTVVAMAANPVFVASIEIGKFLIDMIGKVLGKNHDDMIGLFYMSLNQREHYPHGERKKDNVPDLTNNVLLDYSIFGF